MDNGSKSSFYSLFFIFLASISAVGFVLERHQSMILGMAFFSAFFAYFWLARYHHNQQSLFYLGIGARLLLFIGLPTLSDDIYRFIWDGRMLANGLDPYALTPSQWMESGREINGLDAALFQKLNSPNYFTIYPPLNQGLFWLSTVIGGESLLTSTNVIRLFILLSEISSYFVLRKILAHFKKNEGMAHWYFLNPLVILEFTGNVHFEAFVVLFLLLGLLFLTKLKFTASGLAFGGAIAVKLLPLIFLPALLLKFRWKNGVIICLVAMILGAITLIPLLNSEFIPNLQSSFSLYFQKFEFNASIYFLIREVGFLITGYNIIETLGPILALTTIAVIGFVAIYGAKKGWSTGQIMLLTLGSYLSLATTVHPWYILPVIPLGLLGGYYFPIFWSLVTFVTYFGYHPTGFELSAAWIVFEYLSLWIFIIVEFAVKKRYSIR